MQTTESEGFIDKKECEIYKTLLALPTEIQIKIVGMLALTLSKAIPQQEIILAFQKGEKLDGVVLRRANKEELRKTRKL